MHVEATFMNGMMESGHYRHQWCYVIGLRNDTLHCVILYNNFSMYFIHLHRYVDTTNNCNDTIQLTHQIPVDVSIIQNMKFIMTHLHVYQEICTRLVFGCGLVIIDVAHIPQGNFTGSEVLLRSPQCHWSNPEGCGWKHHNNLPEAHFDNMV